MKAAIEPTSNPFLAGGCCSLNSRARSRARAMPSGVWVSPTSTATSISTTASPLPREKRRTCRWPWRWAWDRQPWVDACDGASIAPADAAILGYRDLVESLADGIVDPDTIDGLTHLDVDAITADGEGVGARVERALAAGAGRFWLHLDVDVLDEDVFPATDYLMPGGATWDELLAGDATARRLAGARRSLPGLLQPGEGS